MERALEGVRIIEFAAIGPAPFCGMLLADMGADILRIDRLDPAAGTRDVSTRGRRSLALDLKSPAAVETCLRIIERADVLVEGFRPGVMERLGLGPEHAFARNPELVYGRMTGWGQEGPLAHLAGHDINYIALTGALDAIGTAEEPVPPLNLVGDYGGGALYLALGIVAALYERTRSDLGQIVDAAIIDGASSLMSVFHDFESAKLVSPQRDENFLSGAAPFYGVYRCADDLFISLGAIEPQFYSRMMASIGLSAGELGDPAAPKCWPNGRRLIADAIIKKTREEWVAILEGTDACFAPVLTLEEARDHPHMKERDAFVTVEGVVHPAPAPRFSRTPSVIRAGTVEPGEGGREALEDWGVEPADS